MNDDLLKAAINAESMLLTVYLWIDQINDAGGARSISGISKCHAFLKSMEKNRGRAESLVMAPIREAIEKRQAQ